MSEHGELHVEGVSLEDWIAREFEAQPERVALAEAEHALAPKRCGECGKDLDGAEEATGEDVGPDEYVVMISITPEDLGKRAYLCSACLNDQSKRLPS